MLKIRRRIQRLRQARAFGRAPRLRNVERLAQADHLVATKNGLYLTSPEAWWPLCDGHYYGVTFAGDRIVAFQAFLAIGRGRLVEIPRGGAPRTGDESRAAGAARITRATEGAGVSTSGREMRTGGDAPVGGKARSGNPERSGDAAARGGEAGDGPRAAGPRVVRDDLSVGCHQIDALGGRLFVTDTYNNAVLTLDAATCATRAAAHPLGRLDRGRESANYAHINSVLADGRGTAWLVCHNESAKTGRTSDLLVCDEAFTVRETIGTPFRSAHNLVRVEGESWVCDSLGRTVATPGRVLHEFENFTRGLSVTARHIVVGESAYGRREERERLGGWVNYFDREWRLLARHRLPGMVQEIRALREPDLGLSEDYAASLKEEGDGRG